MSLVFDESVKQCRDVEDILKRKLYSLYDKVIILPKDAEPQEGDLVEWAANIPQYGKVYKNNDDSVALWVAWYSYQDMSYIESNVKYLKKVRILERDGKPVVYED